MKKYLIKEKILDGANNLYYVYKEEETKNVILDFVVSLNKNKKCADEIIDEIIKLLPSETEGMFMLIKNKKEVD